jgi:4-hydroxyphenylacetate 3-monooxygenase
MVEILQQLGASGFMAIPTERDVAGPQGETIRTYYQAARADAVSRIKLFRLAWDVAMSAFGSRQALYERYFFGDPVRMAGAMFNTYDRRPYMDRVRAFLERADREGPAAESPRDP